MSINDKLNTSSSFGGGCDKDKSCSNEYVSLPLNPSYKYEDKLEKIDPPFFSRRVKKGFVTVIKAFKIDSVPGMDGTQYVFKYNLGDKIELFEFKKRLYVHVGGDGQMETFTTLSKEYFR